MNQIIRKMWPKAFSLLILPVVLLLPTSLFGEPFAVLELFTSQGCSSCPPADRLLIELKKEDRPNVLVLSYHVDYWNYLGWSDPYSLSESTALQRKLAGIIGSSVFTPQLIINGERSYVGSKRGDSLHGLGKALSEKQIPIKISTRREGNTLSYEIANSPKNLPSQNLMVQAIGYSPSVITDVNRGENHGKKLSHVNAVRWITYGEAGAKKSTLQVPASSSDLEIALLVRDPRSLKILGYDRVISNSLKSRTLS